MVKEITLPVQEPCLTCGGKTQWYKTAIIQADIIIETLKENSLLRTKVEKLEEEIKELRGAIGALRAEWLAECRGFLERER